MVWFKVDDSFADHPKVLSIPRGAARLRAVGLWTALGSWCGKHLTDGLFERHMIAEYSGANVDANHLLRVGLWEPTDDPGVLQFHDWHDWQPSRERVLGERAEAAERMRANRARKKRDRSPERSGEHGTNFGGRSATPTRPDPTRAAAAAADERGSGGPDELPNPVPTTDLPVGIDILRSRLQRYTVLRALRFDQLTPTRVADLEALVETHGDEALVKVALDTCGATPPRSVAAFIGTWQAMPHPGQRLRVVSDDPCPQPGHTDPAHRCRQCASERKAAR